MANSKQALKRARQTVKRNEHNVHQRSRMRTFLKRTYKAVNDGDIEKAQASFSLLTSDLDRLANKGLIHKNKAARHKRRLNQHIKQKIASSSNQN